jgi:hypothetical protein
MRMPRSTRKDKRNPRIRRDVTLKKWIFVVLPRNSKNYKRIQAKARKVEGMNLSR